MVPLLSRADEELPLQSRAGAVEEGLKILPESLSEEERGERGNEREKTQHPFPSCHLLISTSASYWQEADCSGAWEMWFSDSQPSIIL